MSLMFFMQGLERLANWVLLLEIDGNQFGGAEVFQGLGNLETKFLGEFEISIYGVARRENDGRIIGEVDPLVTEFPGGQCFYAEERSESEFCFKLALKGLLSGHLGRSLL